MNTVILKGNLARDPELRFTPQGTAMCGFDIAINRKWNDANGQLKEEVGFFKCEAWGKTSEVICEYFKKGRPILIQGRLKQDQWEDKATGAKRSAVKVVVDRFDFCGEGKAASGEAPQRSSRAEAPQPDAAGGAAQEDQPQDEDRPF
jgi:single-strand DNA-binding protein